jgi:hypothetical protein
LFPVLAGFTCELEVVEDVLVVGDVCSAILDADDAYCTTADTLVYCDPDTEIVVESDCAVGGGTCAGVGANAICNYPWAEGNPCNWLVQYDQAVCSGMNLLQCSTANIIVSVSCQTYCEDTYGATNISGAGCGTALNLGYDACECTVNTCNIVDYCYDALWLNTCDGFVDCDDYCVTEMGSDKGVCDFASGSCNCG